LRNKARREDAAAAKVSMSSISVGPPAAPEQKRSSAEKCSSVSGAAKVGEDLVSGWKPSKGARGPDSTCSCTAGKMPRLLRRRLMVWTAPCSGLGPSSLGRGVG